MLTRTLVLLAAAVCLASSSSSRAGAGGGAIVGGEVDTGDPEVPALYVEEGASAYICTGTLIAPRVVLTAAHCVNFTGAPPTTFVVVFSPVLGATGDPDDLGTRTAIAWDSDPLYGVDPSGRGHDIGLVRLDAPAPVAPKPYNRAPLDGRIGEPARLVGFGLTLAGQLDAGVRRQARTTIAGVDAEELVYGGAQGICEGDSGGPTLMMIDGVERVVGIHSGGDCNQAGAVIGVDTRVDPYVASFIEPFVAATETAPDPGDPDPDGVSAGCTAGRGGPGVMVLVVLALMGSAARMIRWGWSRGRWWSRVRAPASGSRWDAG